MPKPPVFPILVMLLVPSEARVPSRPITSTVVMVIPLTVMLPPTPTASRGPPLRKVNSVEVGTGSSANGERRKLVCVRQISYEIRPLIGIDCLVIQFLRPIWIFNQVQLPILHRL